MIRRRPEEDDDNPERWLVSYADFITLLFAFFVVMYSVSSVNQSKYKELSSSINTAFTKNKTKKQGVTQTTAIDKSSEHKVSTDTQTKLEATVEKVASPEPQPLSDAQIQKLQREREAMTSLGINLSNKMASLISDGKVRVTQNNRGLRIDINDSVLFSSGSADLAETAKPVLSEIAILLSINRHDIQVEGHTDDTPIHNAAFFSNWELSALRATSVVRMFSEMGISDMRLSALGFGSTQPIGDNSTADGRAKNRHVSLMILYDSLSADNAEGTEIIPALE
jgi:chemotaxis protein MotB